MCFNRGLLRISNYKISSHRRWNKYLLCRYISLRRLQGPDTQTIVRKLCSVLVNVIDYASA
jgi:hypothetical protein